MNFLYIFLGLFFLAMQGVFYFMLVTLTASGEGGTKLMHMITSFWLYFLPSVTVLSAILLLVGYFQEWKYVYSWIFLPMVCAALFIIYLVAFVFEW